MLTRVPSSDSRAVRSCPPSSDKEVATIRELIDHMARTQPEASFLISPETGRVLTFQGLQEQSRFLSTQLREAGLERGDKVAFLLENGLFTAQLFLGAMYGGFVSVPLNVRAGVSQLSYMLDHCDAKVVFVADEYATMMAEVMAQVRRTVQAIPADIDGFPAAGETPPSATSLPVPGPEDQALLMYTSGSTGHPKAAVHSHRTVLSFAANSVRSHQLAGADRSLLMLPLYHINASCVTLVPTLMTGGCVVVPHRFSVSQFWDWLDEHRCTWSAVVPTIIAQLLEWEDPRADKRQAAFQRIRFVRSSSAPLAPSLHREFLDKFPLLLIQAMGSSEAGNVFSNPLPPGKNKIGSPGLPWGFEVKIVDREGVELAAGEPGEIVLRGPAVMQGYYKEPEATAAVLDPDGWLHTGDLAYRDEDGYFFVVGRSKELIIKGGVNIAPRQIDDVLESHPAVREAAAVGVPDRYLGEDLVAFVVLRAGVACEERELLAFCESRLGHFKTPTRIHFADDLPKGPSGKVQRLHLRDEAAQLATGSSGSSRGELAIALGTGQVAHPGLPAAGSSIEQIIAETWTEVLSKAPVDAESNFFALGGHSLLAMQCVSRLRERIPVALSLSDFFENATVAQQAALVRRRLPRDEGQALAGGSAAAREEAWQLKVASSVSPLAIPPRDPALPCPLSTAQRRLWFIEQLNPGLPLYNEAEGVRLLGELNTEAMERALNVIVARHEVLRTTIQVTDNEPVMVVHESWPLQLKKIDLSALTPAERQAEVERLLIDEPRRLYHLEAEPGIRATLLRLAPREHIFILMMHHIFSDRSSLGILFREMATLYRAFCRGESIALPPLLIQYGDYAVWQQQRITDAASAEDLSFWTENLRGAPQLLELPADRPRPLTLSYRGVKRRFRLNPALTKALRDASQREKASLFTLFTAALDTLLYRYTGREDILLGIPIADRERPELQSVIGFLVHTCVLRTGLSGDMTFRELLALVQKEMLELYRHRAVPFDEVVRKLRPERNPSYSPLFQVMINWRDRGLQLSFIGLEGLVVEPLLAQSETAKLDLQLFITDGGDEFWLEMEYSTDLFDEARISRMIGHYQTLLESVASDPGRRLAELPLLTAEERRQLLVEWNNTRVDYPADACVHELFERQAKRTPEAVAVEFNGERLTYSELNRRSTEFAQHLQARGVGPDVLVAVYVDRSLELVIALLGILKAGGAYLPVDLVFPQERVAFMLGDAQPRVLVTVTKLLAELPRNQSEVVCVNDFAALSEAPMARPPESRHLAYVIYTSGSTGKPKGVEICHRAVVNFLNSMRQVPGMEAQDTLLSVTSPSFDIFGLELWLPLTSGAKVVIVSQDVAMDGSQLAKVMAARGVTVMQATPSTWRVLLEAGWEGDLSLKILCGGEAWPEELAAQLLPKCSALWNMYGPTETTIWSAVYPVEKGKPILIGDPIANTQFYVVDSDLQPVPVGVPGELLIGGDGLARGYLRRPELTAEKFIPDPFSASAGSRLYRTGDLVRYLPDGNLEFLGRLDQQVKIHGFRIELGEIEAALRQHPAVQQTVVIAREDTPGDKRLVAYVVVNPEYEIGSDEAESHSEHLDGWQTMWDETYQQSAEIPDHTFNIAGWNSSYTGEAIPAEQMRTWVDTTVERILALRPQRVWEIGCGTGLLLHRLAPHCLHYYATDFSATAVNTLQRQIAGSAVTNKVVLKQAQAHDFTGIEAGSFDVVILNSVAQYFPDVNYLVRVLEGAVRAVKPGGAIFLGDIRSEPLLNAFHAAVQLEQAPASLPGADLRQRIQRALSQESELAISPGFFIALWKHLPAITQVEIQLKRGRHHNELSLFRYDVVLRVGATVKSTENQTRFDWQQRGFSVPDLRRYLEEERPAALTLTGVPNARLQREFKLLEILAGVECPATVGELRGALRADSAPNAIDPEDLWTLGESLGYTVQVRWSDGGAAASCDAVFLRRENGAGDGVDSVFHFPGEPSASRPWSAYANNPLQRALISNLTPRLSSYLQESLPDYMVPSAFVTLGTLPLTPNGKVDRRALPPPAAERLAGAISADLVPQNETERKIAAIWQDVLGITSVGREDNFFDLGGDSFRLIRVRNHLQRTFGKDIPLVDMFRCTTVRALAQYFAGRPAELTAPDHTQEELEARRGASRRHRQLRRLLVDELREHLNE